MDICETSTPIRPQPVRSTVTVPAPAPRDLQNEIPDWTEKVTSWMENIPCSPIEPEPEIDPADTDITNSGNRTVISQSLFTSVSERDYGKFRRRNRLVWSTDAEHEFSHIWKFI
jgi:hypothetical protein